MTQIVLGTAVGGAVLGKKVGNIALLYGFIGGTIPDLDATPIISRILLRLSSGTEHLVILLN